MCAFTLSISQHTITRQSQWTQYLCSNDYLTPPSVYQKEINPKLCSQWSVIQVIFLSTSAKIVQIHILKCENSLLFFVLHYSKLNIFGFWTWLDETRHLNTSPWAVGNWDSPFFRFFFLHSEQLYEKISSSLTDNENNLIADLLSTNQPPLLKKLPAFSYTT